MYRLITFRSLSESIFCRIVNLRDGYYHKAYKFSVMITITAMDLATSTLSQLGLTFITQLGFSGTVGFLIGYGVKKLVKVAATAFGLYLGVSLVLGAWLESRGILTVTVDYDKLTALVESSTTWVITQATSLLASVIQGIAIFGSLGVGFAVGFKRG